MEAYGKFIGLLGFGFWGKNIFRNLYELGVLHTACDLNEQVIKEKKKEYSSINYTTRGSDVFSSPDIKAVVIATPASTHYELTKKALIAGKDVLVEKPLALSVKEGEELVELAKRENRILMVGHILLYHPGILKLKEIIQAGELGKIQYIYSNRLNIGKLRTEENILWSFAPHDISVILMLLEDEPIRVSAFGGDYLSKGIYDTTLSSLEFRNGVKGHIFVSWLHPFKEQKLVVVGSGVMAVFDDLSKEKLFLYPHKINWKDGKVPIAQKADYIVVPFDHREPLKEELCHFIDCVKNRQAPRTDGNDGLKVLNVLESLENSLQKRSIYVNVERK